MKGLTSLGKKLRMLRIDNDEITANMAKKLGISVSYLSAIEHGKRNIPSNFLEKLFQVYVMTKKEKRIIEKLIVNYSKEMKVNLSKLNSSQKELSLLYARKIDSLNEEQVKKIRRFLNGEDE